MSFTKLQIGDVVLSSDGSDLGAVREIGETCFRLATKRRRDQWLPGDAIEHRESGIALLRVAKDSLRDAVIDIERHRGLHGHQQHKGEGGGVPGLLTPALLVGGGLALLLRNKERREQLATNARNALQRVKSRTAGENGSIPFDGPRAGSDYAATSTLSPMPRAGARETARPDSVPSTRAFGAPPASEVPPPNITAEELSVSRRREVAIVGLVSAAFPAMNLRVSPVAVRTLEGRDEPTLRFTLDETYSADLRRDQLMDTAMTDDRLANIVIDGLRQQVPPEHRTV
jgi:hypothetical protein